VSSQQWKGGKGKNEGKGELKPHGLLSSGGLGNSGFKSNHSGESSSRWPLWKHQQMNLAADGMALISTSTGK